MPDPLVAPVETKFLPFDANGGAPALAFKAAEENDGAESAAARVLGYASTFGGVPDSYGDVIAPGAFGETIREWQRRSWRLPMLLNHDPACTVGVWNGLAEDAIGLKVEGELTPGHRAAQDLTASLKHGAVSGLSIGYRSLRSSDGPNGTRILEEVELFEISAVTHPANERARVTGVKSAQAILTLRDLETLLREHLGWSRRETEAVTERVFKSAQNLGDPPARDERGANADSAGARERRDVGIGAATQLLADLRGLRLHLTL